MRRTGPAQNISDVHHDCFGGSGAWAGMRASGAAVGLGIAVLTGPKVNVGMLNVVGEPSVTVTVSPLPVTKTVDCSPAVDVLHWVSVSVTTDWAQAELAKRMGSRCQRMREKVGSTALCDGCSYVASTHMFVDDDLIPPARIMPLVIGVGFEAPSTDGSKTHALAAKCLFSKCSELVRSRGLMLVMSCMARKCREALIAVSTRTFRNKDLV